MGGSLSDGQLGKSPHGGGIEKWAYVMLGNIKRGINEWEFGTDFACVHGWKKVLGFGADISKRLLKIRGGGAQAMEVLPNTVRNGRTVSWRQRALSF